MNQRLPITEADLDQAARMAAALDTGGRLGALVFDVLSRQAEGRTLFVGEKFVAGRAEAHGVRSDADATPVGDLLVILERGPESSMQWALCGALYVQGFGHAVQAEPAERKALVARFAGHGDFLELGSPYRALSLVGRMLDEQLAGEVHSALGALVLRDDGSSMPPQVRARNAGRIAVLAEARSMAARAALASIAASASDAFSRTLSASLLGNDSVPPGNAPISVHGRRGRYPSGALRSLLRWLSGVALLSSAWRLLSATLGVRREVDIELGERGLRVLRRTKLLGRVVRSGEDLHMLHVVRRARRAARYPAVHLVLGTFCFALGLLLGGVFFYDAVRLGEHSLALIGVVLLLGGTATDLLVDVLVPAGSGRVALELDLGRGARLKLTGVRLAEADRFLQALWQRISRQEGNARAVD